MKAGAAPAEAKIDWAKPIDQVYNLIRDATRRRARGPRSMARNYRSSMPARLFFGVLRTCPARSAKSPASPRKASRSLAQGGLIEVLKAKLEDGKKISGGELVQAGGVQAGNLLGS